MACTAARHSSAINSTRSTRPDGKQGCTIDFSIVLPLIFPTGRATITIVSSCVNRRCGQTGSSPTRCRESRPGAPGAASGLPCPETLPPQSAEANLCRACPLQHCEGRVSPPGSAQFGWNRGTLLNLYVQALHPVMTDGVKRFLFSTLFKFQVEKGVLS